MNWKILRIRVFIEIIIVSDDGILLDDDATFRLLRNNKIFVPAELVGYFKNIDLHDQFFRFSLLICVFKKKKI